MGKQPTINYDTPKSWEFVTNEPDVQRLESSYRSILPTSYHSINSTVHPA